MGGNRRPRTICPCTSVRLVGGSPRDLLAVGAPSLYPEDYFRGRVFLFEKQGTSWVEKAVFTAPTDEVGTSFGYAVAMSSSALVVGAPGEDNNRGNAYLIPLPLAEVPGDRKRSSGGFNDYNMLSLGDLVPHYNRSFGHSAAISRDVAVVTANYGNPVFVFESVDSSWRLADQLQPPDGHGNQYFGYSTAVDGRRIVVGNLNASATVDGAGSVHVFDDDGSSSWTETAVLGPTEGEKNDKFGWTLDVAGESIAVGTRANYAQVFHQSDQSWGPSDILKDCDEARRSFGRSLSLDHSALLVGSYGYGGGVFYPFRKEDLTATALTSQDVPRPSPKHILAFPNPSRGNLTVRLGPDQGPGARLEIFDLLGRRVHGPQHVSGEEVEVPGTLFRPGVYLVRVSRHSSSISTTWVKH